VSKQKDLISKLRRTTSKGDSAQTTNVREVLTETIQRSTSLYEDLDSLMRRCDIIRAFMKEFLRSNPLEGQQKYGIVSHSFIIACLTADGLNKEDPLGLSNYTWLENCQATTYNKY